MFHKLPVKQKLKLWFYTLFYQSFFSFDYCVDVCVEPLVWFVDHFTKILGKIFVIVVCILITLVAFVAHVLGTRFWWAKSPPFTIFLYILGYWVLINIAFNYYQAVFVSPGVPSDTKRIGKSGVTICKTCISPKPSRTHHCSVCRRCYLKMDHHCPWVNNCIGHFNHRYFFLTAVYICLGCVYVMLFGAELAFKQVLWEEDILTFQSHRNLLGPVQIDTPHDGDLIDSQQSSALILQRLLGIQRSRAEFEKADLVLGLLVSRVVVKTILYTTGFLCIGASICLGGLAYWHGNLISKGETSIEYHINKSERKKQSNFVNLYDLGRTKNWILFLGLDRKDRSFWRHILFPSTHSPTGDGYNWDHILQHTLPRKLHSTFLDCQGFDR